MIGENTYSASDLDRVDIGKFCSIAGGVSFHEDDNHACIEYPKLVSTFPFREKWGIESHPNSSGKGRIKVGNDVWIGEGARILSGVVIGDGAIIGAGTVVSKDVPAYSIVVGNPATVKKYRFKPYQIKRLLAMKWWDWEDGTIKERIEDMLDINVFIKKYG